MKAAFLPDRGVVKVSGADARDFLNGLVTTDVTLLRPGLGRFGALLTPQGKITVDFLITEAPSGHGGGFLIDCPRALAQGLADKLGFYKLRAKVAVENLSDSLGVLAAWDGEPAMKPDLAFADPRNAALGWRILAPDGTRAKGRRSDRRGSGRQRRLRRPSHRLGRSARRPRLHVWRRVSARNQHGPPARRRFRQGLLRRAGSGVADAASRHRAHPNTVRILLEDFSPEPGTTILAGDKVVGTLGSTAAPNGLALIRVDRAADALAAGMPLTSGGLAIRLADPDDLLTAPKQTVA